MRLVLAFALLLPTAGAAQPPAPVTAAPATNPALASRAAELVALFNGGDPAALFHPDFLVQIPAAQVRALAAQLVGAVGAAQRVAALVPTGPNAASVAIAAERGTIDLQLEVEPGGAGRIVRLRVAGAVPAATQASIPAVVAALQALPGRTTFGLYDLAATGPQLVAGHDADRPAPIGSAFKLVILAELVRRVEAGALRWGDTVTLDGGELPGGAYAGAAKGTIVSYRTLAERMISVSDNSATDLLLFALGRERVEAMQRTLGIADPGRNRPFLGTMEAFKLKAVAGLRDRWIAADERGRRALLPAIDATPGSALAGLFADGRPVAPDRIEWFLSPTDLARTMDWLRRHSEAGPGAEARRILAVNPGVVPDVAGRYDYVGYKGGSEPGVMAMTLLLRSPAGRWQVLAASWTNPAAPVDEGRFAALVNRAAALAAR